MELQSLGRPRQEPRVQGKTSSQETSVEKRKRRRRRRRKEGEEEKNVHQSLEGKGHCAKQTLLSARLNDWLLRAGTLQVGSQNYLGYNIVSPLNYQLLPMSVCDLMSL